ncbi:MAG: 50S ribosomal protein L11 methyltransferase [Lachnospiraceae bacterium]|nr:50S ribosomal protein L11 methyltransferase [Lachnospiraceae bacterium]
MQWHKYTLTIDPSCEEAVTGLLYSLGIEGVEIEDGLFPTEEELGNMFVDLSPELAPDELPPITKPAVHFYLRIAKKDGEDAADAQTGDAVDDSYTIHDKAWTEAEAAALLRDLEKAWPSVSGGVPFDLSCEISREEDWRDNWKQYFQPLLANDLLILPCWEEIPEEYAADIAAGRLKTIRLDPGTAFGSGTHESTRLILDALKKWQKGGEKVLDIGCGSGILSLAALAYGAESVLATELDPACETVIQENIELNDLKNGKIRLIMGNILSEDKSRFGSGYDLILCNILAPVICALAEPGQADALAAPGALFITSGIYKEHRETVERSFRNNPSWKLVETTELGEWVSVAARRV